MNPARRLLQPWSLVTALVILLPLLLRVFYFIRNPIYFYYPDTYHYVNRAQEIARGEPLVNPFRLPLYPLILRYTLGLDGSFDADGTTINRISFQPLMLFHFLMGIVGFIGFILLAKRLFGLSWRWHIAILLFGINIRLFGWEKNILTEATTITLMIWFIYALVSCIRTDSRWHLILTIVFAVLLFLIRPVYVLLCPLMIPIIIWRHHAQKTYRRALVSGLLLAMTMLIPLAYLYGNYRLYGYPNISTVSDADIFGKVIQYNLPVEDITIDSPYWPSVQNCLRAHAGNDPIHIEDCIAPLNIQDNAYRTKTATVLGSIGRTIILRHLPQYVWKSLQLLPAAAVGTDPDPYTWFTTYADIPLLSLLLEWLLLFFNQLQKVYIVFFFLLPLHAVVFWKNPSRKNAAIAVLGCAIFYALAMNTFFVQSEYSRLRSAVDPLFFLFCLPVATRALNTVLILITSRRSLSSFCR